MPTAALELLADTHRSSKRLLYMARISHQGGVAGLPSSPVTSTCPPAGLSCSVSTRQQASLSGTLHPYRTIPIYLHPCLCWRVSPAFSLSLRPPVPRVWTPKTDRKVCRRLRSQVLSVALARGYIFALRWPYLRPLRAT